MPGLLTPGHWPSNHWPANHWANNHWLNGFKVISLYPIFLILSESVEFNVVLLKSEKGEIMAIARQVGETVRLNATITDIAGDAGDPSTVQIAINLPDGTEALPATDMINSDVGNYYYDYLIPVDIGTYIWNVTAVGIAGRVTISKDMFSVNAAM